MTEGVSAEERDVGEVGNTGYVTGCVSNQGVHTCAVGDIGSVTDGHDDIGLVILVL